MPKRNEAIPPPVQWRDLTQAAATDPQLNLRLTSSTLRQFSLLAQRLGLTPNALAKLMIVLTVDGSTISVDRLCEAAGVEAPKHPIGG